MNEPPKLIEQKKSMYEGMNQNEKETICPMCHGKAILKRLGMPERYNVAICPNENCPWLMVAVGNPPDLEVDLQRGRAEYVDHTYGMEANDHGGIYQNR